MKKTVQKTLLIFSGLIFFLLLLEASLRLGGFFLLSLQSHRNRIAMQKKSDITILCLGESTTMDSTRQYNYPFFLDKILNEKHENIRFRVINKGVDGTNTDMMLQRIPSYLKRYNPDIVVAMIGINDGIALDQDCLFSDDGSAGFPASLRIYKLFLILRSHLKYSLDSKFWRDLSFPEEPPRIQDYIDRAYSYRDRGELFKMKQILEKAIGQFPHNDRLLVELGIYYLIVDSRDEAMGCFQQALELNPKNKWAYVLIAHIHRTGGRYMLASETMEDAIRNISEDQELKQIFSHYGAKGSFHHLPLEARPMLVKNYPQLAKKLAEKNIALVAVQYPARPIRSLQKILPAYGNIYLVDNEQIFKNAIEENGYRYYFIDRFGGDFGHMNDEGNRLLAENIASVISRKILRSS